MANLSGAGAPNKHTVGAIGDIYTNTNNGLTYQCVSIISVDDSDDPAVVEYEWDLVELEPVEEPEEPSGLTEEDVIAMKRWRTVFETTRESITSNEYLASEGRGVKLYRVADTMDMGIPTVLRLTTDDYKNVQLIVGNQVTNYIPFNIDDLDNCVIGGVIAIINVGNSTLNISGLTYDAVPSGIYQLESSYTHTIINKVEIGY